MGILIQHGTVINADSTVKADVLIEGEKIAAVGANLPAAGHTLVDATGLLVMPGGMGVVGQVTVRDVPLREHIDVPVRESLIVELYSK